MKKNRRNYYRILHVQAEAPLEIIKASYRALMGPLRAHPDLGGEHQAASLINEAYAVLSDPAKRAAYDLSLSKEQVRGARAKAEGKAETANGQRSPHHWSTARTCPLCLQPFATRPPKQTSCTRCEAPLTPPPTTQGRELFGRRSGARLAKNHPVVVTPGWRAAALSAVMRDVSLSGARLLTAVPVAPQQVIRITDPHFDAVATVVACRHQNGLFSLHARFLTLRPTQRTGGFVSARA
jgi:hypothetical protein